MDVLVLQHIACEPPGVYEDVLRERGALITRVELDEGEELPERRFDAIVAMGGPMSVNDETEHPWLVEEKRVIGDAVRAGTPYWGACLGVQLLAAALGARVYPGSAPEVGLLPVALTDEGRADPVTGVVAGRGAHAAVARRHVRPSRGGDAARELVRVPEPGVPLPRRVRGAVPPGGLAGHGRGMGSGP